MIRRARFSGKRKVALDRPPFAFGADAAVAVRSGIHTVVNVTAAQKRIVLAVCDQSAFRVLWRGAWLVPLALATARRVRRPKTPRHTVQGLPYPTAFRPFHRPLWRHTDERARKRRAG